MLTTQKDEPALAGAIDTLQEFVEDTARTVRSADLMTLRKIRRHPRAAAALAVLAGLVSGLAVGALVQHRLDAQ